MRTNSAAEFDLDGAVQDARLYSAYLFDLDGTLIDTAPDIHAAANAALQGAGFAAIELGLTRQFVGLGGRVLLTRALLSQGVESLGDDRSEAMYRDFLSHYDQHIAVHSRPYEGVVEALNRLRSFRIPLVVITNKLEGLSDKLLREIGMRDCFELLIGLDSLSEHKPHPLPVLYACEKLGVAPSEALFVGDSATDVATARAAGCDVVCVDYGYNGGVAPDELGADRVIASFKDLL